MSKKNIIRIVAICVAAILLVGVFVAVLTTPKEATSSVEQRAGFATITSVAGCTFMVNSSFSDQATAVTQISDGVAFERNGFYSYKNGVDQYMLFQLDGVVVAVEKGTTFNFEGTKKKEDALANSSIIGIWLAPEKKGLKYEHHGNRSEGIVTAQVVITNNLYNDFVGKVITLTDNGEEWSMFVGVPGTRYKDLSGESKSGIDVIAESFELSDNTGEFVEPEYAVVISGNNAVDPALDEEPVGEVIEVQHSDDTASGNAVSDNAVSGNTVSEDEASVSEDATTVSENEPEEKEDTVEVTAKADDGKEEKSEEKKEEEPSEEVAEEATEEATEEQSEEAEEPEEEQEEEKPEPEPEKPQKPETPRVTVKSIVKNEYDENKAYTSSIYSMLNIGQTGLFDAKANNGKDPDRLMVKIETIQNSQETYDCIKKGKARGFLPLDVENAPPGCHWESAVYDINYSGVSSKPYTNIKLVGADGKALKFRGIPYSTRTYDISGVRADGDWLRGFVVYYAVPNGCTEYVLRVGDGDDITGWQSAWYYVNRTL